MTRKYCDRCGKQIGSCAVCNAVFPQYKILETIGIGRTFEIDFCDKCTKEFERWIANCSEEENDG